MAVPLQVVRASNEGASWQPRAGAARALRIAVVLAPVAAAFLAAALFAAVVPPWDGAAVWPWRLLVVVVSTACSLGVERGLRHVASLSWLLRLSLVFPDQAPSRFSMALRTGTARQLEERLAEANALGGSSEISDQDAALRLLELVAALNAHDRLTRGHSERVRAYSRMIGEELRLSPADLDRLNWAALLHDVGKLEVPAEILSKAGELTDDEWAQIRRHPEAGERLVAPLRQWLGEWVGAVRDHHERWDGRGYPRGTAGTGICLAGRIVAVADAFDVMTAARSYKRPISAAAAREELLRCAGTQFDERIVRAFLAVSLGKVQRLVGPLSWLAQLPTLQGVPVASVAGNAAATVVTASVVAVGSVAGVVPAAEPPATEVVELAVETGGGEPLVGGDASTTTLVVVPPGEPTTTVPASTETTLPGSTESTASGAVDPDEEPVPTSPTTEPPTTTPTTAAPTTPTTVATTATTRAPTTTSTTTSTTATSSTVGAVNARNDEAQLDGNGDVTVRVLENDVDPSGGGLRIVNVTAPDHGWVRVLSNGRIYYESSGRQRADRFTYTVRDSLGNEDTAQVTVAPSNGSGSSSGASSGSGSSGQSVGGASTSGSGRSSSSGNGSSGNGSSGSGGN